MMVHLMGMDLDGEAKDIIDGNIHFWYQKYSPPCTKVLSFVACRVTSKVLIIVAEDRSWVDTKTIKSEKRYSISSDVSEKQNIFNTFACQDLSFSNQATPTITAIFVVAR